MKLVRALFLSFAVLACVATLSGCTTTFYHVRPGNVLPATATTSPGQRTSMWEHAIGVLLDQGYVPQVLNKDACYISAKRREDIDSDAFAGTIVIFSVSPEGRVRLELTGGGVFDSEDKFLSALTQRQTQILTAILNNSDVH